MATNANLPAGAFITSLGGKRCTAIPKTDPAPAQPTTALPETSSPTFLTSSSIISNSTSSTTAVLPTAEAGNPEETAVAPSPLPPAEASPSTTSTTPPPLDETTEEIPGPDATTTPDAGAPAPQPSTSSADTNGPDITPEETVPSTLSPFGAPTQEQQPEILQLSLQTNDDVAPTTTTGELTEATTATELDATTTDLTEQETPTAGGNGAVSMEISSATATATAPATTPPPVQSSTGLGPPTSNAEAAGASEASPPSTQTKAAVIGGVIGGLAIVSLVVFLIFFLRRRNKRKRRSTLLTSMFGDPGFGRGEKEAVTYTINRTSLGPTPASEKLKNTFVFGYMRIRGRFSDLVHSRSDSPRPTVDLDRGTSQFGPPLSSNPSSRSSSRAGRYDDETPNLKERFFGWWGRLGRSGPPRSSRTNNDPFAGARNIRRASVSRGRSSERGTTAAPKTSTNAQPDFLTLLKMDEEATQRAAGTTGGGTSSSSKQKRRSTIPGGDHFLGGLGFDFDGAMGPSPFSDANAIRPSSRASLHGDSSVRHDSATIPPLALAKGEPGADSNPFSDANAITNSGPATYVQDLRRSRGRSASMNNTNTNNFYNSANGTSRRTTHRSSNSNYGFLNRESGISVDSDTYQKRNTKFRSDPFDLDRPELLSGSRAGSRGSNGAGVAAPPRARAHSRGESYASWTSRYSGFSDDGANIFINVGAITGGSAKANTNANAGSSYDNWGDPGPDVGPAVAGKTRASQASQGSVGKAL